MNFLLKHSGSETYRMQGATATQTNIAGIVSTRTADEVVIIKQQ
jgi:hypothetical protein